MTDSVGSSVAPIVSEPCRDRYDVVIVGGAAIGSSIAWWLASEPGFDGSLLVLDADMTYANSSTARTNSCMRQQFSHELNIEMSQFAADHVRNFQEHLGDPDVPELFTDHFGYLYLAADEAFATTLRRNQQVQAARGAATQILDAEQLGQRFPFLTVDDLVCGSHNPVDEGYFDGATMFDWWRRCARRRGAEYVEARVVAMRHDATRVSSIVLDGGREVECGTVVNAAGPRAAATAAMVDLDLPIEARKRFTFVFDCAESLEGRLPLLIDPSGVHVRSDGDAYMTGCPPDPDPEVDPDDLTVDADIFEDRIWPILAHRVPAFERIKVTNRWAGHYSYNPFDHNVVVGPHPEMTNFVFANGFSGHGLQQAPAIGRAVAEVIAHGSYRTLDLEPFGYQRLIDRVPVVESAVI